VRTIAQWLTGGSLARAEELSAGSFSRPFDGLESGAVMAAVTERLFLRLPAGTPEIVFAGFHFDCDRRLVCNNWICHGDTSGQVQ